MTSSRIRRPTRLVCFGLLSVIAGCSKCGARNEGASTQDAGSSLSAKRAASDDFDPEVARALEQVAECDQFKPGLVRLEDGGVDLEKDGALFCPATTRFSELMTTIEESDDYLSSRRAKATRTCERALEHANAFVRQTAHSCVAGYPAAIAETRATLEKMLTGIEHETEAHVRGARWQSFGALDPTSDDGLTKRAVGLARKVADNSLELTEALEALTPESEYRPTHPEVLAFAKEIAKTGRAGRAMVDLVSQSTAAPAEACEVYVDLLTSNGPGWVYGIRGATSTLGSCKSLKGRIVDAVAARAAKASTTPDAWSSLAVTFLRGEVDELGLDARDKAKLRAALNALPESARTGLAGSQLSGLLEELQ